MKKKILFSILTVLLLLLLFIVIVFIDNVALDSKYYYKYRYGADCTFIVPSEYRIVYSKESDKYAVASLLIGDYYLYDNGFFISTTFSNVRNPSVFSDSCGAKAFLKHYLKQQEPKFKP